MRFIPLTQGQFAIVDDEDFEWLSEFRWYAHWNKTARTFYARRNTGKHPNRKNVKMHRQIMDAKPGEQVDHWDHNGLNNQRQNLRVGIRKPPARVVFPVCISTTKKVERRNGEHELPSIAKSGILVCSTVLIWRLPQGRLLNCDFGANTLAQQLAG